MRKSRQDCVCLRKSWSAQSHIFIILILATSNAKLYLRLILLFSVSRYKLNVLVKSNPRLFK